MKNLKAILSAATLAAFTLVSCNPQEVLKPEFELSGNLVEVSASGGKASLEYSLKNPSQDVSIEFDCGSEWLGSFAVATDTTIEFVVEANDASEIREADVNVRYGSISRTFTVSQSAAEPAEFVLNESELSCGFRESDLSVGFSVANPVQGEDITFSTESEWISDVVIDDESYEISFKVLQNESSSSRAAEIDFVYAGIERTLVVSQDFLDIESMTLDRTKAILVPEESQTLNVSVVTGEADIDDLIVWSSSDDTVVAVDASGNISAVSEGSATVEVSVFSNTVSCEVFVCETPQIGSFYYSDGTFSKERDAEKDVIGIIYWVGDPTIDDTTLKADHPWCRHGLVIALNEAQSRWQEAYLVYQNTVASWAETNMPECISTLTPYDGVEPDYFNKNVGYNNSKVIEAFNNAPENSEWTINAFEIIKDYRETVKAPETSSDWYMPSTKDASLFVTGEYEGNIREISQSFEMRDFLNPILYYDVEGGTYIGQNGLFYWTSCEYNHLQAYMVAANSGAVFGYMKQLKTGIVRPVLAF